MVDGPCVVKASKNILQPLTIEMTMVRNLSAAYYFALPSVKLEGAMNTVNVSIFWRITSFNSVILHLYISVLLFGVLHLFLHKKGVN